MIRKFFTSHTSLPAMAMVIASGLFSVSCEKENSDTPQVVPDRAVVVYMVASNSLGSYDFDIKDMKEMLAAAKAGDLRSGRLVVYRQSYDGVPVLQEVTANGLDTIKLYDNSISSLSIARMRGVINDVKTALPAKEYGIILWSHGNGWLRAGAGHTGETPIVSGRAFGQEGGIDKTNRYMDTESLASALTGQDLAFAYFDCCYMGGIEVLYDMRKSVPRLVASVAELPAEGMPYNLTLPYIMAPEKADLEGAAKATFDYYNSRSGEDRTCTMSVYDMTQVDGLSEALKDLYSWHPKTPDGFTPQKFMTEKKCYYFDLRHYVENLGAPDGADATSLSAFDDAKQAVYDAIDKVVTYGDATPYLWDELRVSHHCGISTQFLTSSTDADARDYKTTTWWRDIAYRLFED